MPSASPALPVDDVNALLHELRGREIERIPPDGRVMLSGGCPDRAYFDWFATPFLSILTIVLVEVWHNTPFMMLVLLAGLQSIPPDLYEAARADGASAWKSFWFITLPLLKFTAAVAVMIRMIDLTKLFGLIFVLTFGGPGGATETLAFNTYLVGFNDFRMSYASALSYLIIVIVLVLTLIFLRLSRPRDARAAA